MNKAHGSPTHRIYDFLRIPLEFPREFPLADTHVSLGIPCALLTTVFLTVVRIPPSPLPNVVPSRAVGRVPLICAPQGKYSTYLSALMDIVLCTGDLQRSGQPGASPFPFARPQFLDSVYESVFLDRSKKTRNPTGLKNKSPPAGLELI